MCSGANVVMYNLGSSRDWVCKAGIEVGRAGPGFSPVEIGFSKLTAHLGRAAERIRNGLRNRIGRLIDQITPASSPTLDTSVNAEKALWSGCR